VEEVLNFRLSVAVLRYHGQCRQLAAIDHSERDRHGYGGAVEIPDSCASQAVTLTATGGPLTISSISVTGADASSFVFENNCGTSLAAGASCSIHGHFDPMVAGTLTAAVTITDNASNSPQSIALSGDGVSQQ
jgi:hypothetical protein